MPNARAKVLLVVDTLEVCSWWPVDDDVALVTVFPRRRLDGSI